ncbi:MAG: pyridoxal-phosphate dependent enzyme, partial [Halobacteriaceae archaeon]
ATIHEIDGDYDTVIERCMDYVDANPEKYYSPNQYENPQNPLAHEWNTATEIWEQIPEHITHLVGGAGTGGSITGLAQGLSAFHRMCSSSSLFSDADRSPLSIICYEPATGDHHIEGLKYMQGTVHTPGIYNEEVIDTKHYISTTKAFEGAKLLREKYADNSISIVDTGQHDESTVRENLRVDGDFKVGPSSGAAFSIINELAQSTDLSVDDTIVFLLYDRGDRYQTLPICE